MPFTSRTPVLNIRDVTGVLPFYYENSTRPWNTPRDEVVTELADGRIVVVWSGSQYGDNVVRFQILNAAGAAITEPASVFGVEDVTPRFISVTALADGGFAIRGEASIQRYSASGVPNAPIITVPAVSSGGTMIGEIAALGDGFVAASAGAGQTVVLNFYSADNQLQSQQTVGTGVRTIRDIQLSVHEGATAGATRIAAVWAEAESDQFSLPWSNIVVQVLDGAGNPIGGRIVLEPDGMSGVSGFFRVQPDVAFLADGSFVVTWSAGSSNRNSDPIVGGVYAQHFSGDGVALGGIARVGGGYGGQAVSSSVVPLEDGGYLVVWMGGGHGRAQQFDAQSVRVGGETSFELIDASGAVALSDGRVFVVGWLQHRTLSPNINVETGNNADNTYQGTAGDDTYSGLTGNDTIHGGAGNDLLYGNEGNDFLYGGAGDDILVGGPGNDVIDGGDGFDVIQLDQALVNYFVEQTATGYRVWNGLEYDDVTNVEGVYIGGSVYSMAEFRNLSFNGLAYIAGYADLANGYGANALAGYQHYINNGRAEGRAIVFNPQNYLAANYDLAAGFGDDFIAAARHFIEHGRFEGRQTSGFNALLYGASNPDLARIYGGNVAGLTQHFVDRGASEGRPVSGFDALLYGASNPDLARVYHANAAGLINHYLATGADEGRAVSGFNALIYAATHADLARYFGSDANGALLHYLNYGVTEGRAAGGFDSVAYLLSYPDLAGTGANGALLHWLNNGADEGRIGDDVFGREQGAAHTLTGGVGQASLERAGDHDWFQFDLVGGQDAVIRLSGVTTGGGTLTDGWLRLYNEAGVLVATNRGPVGGSDAEITFRPTVGGRYYLVVAGETDTQTGTYRVTVTGAAATVAAAAHEEAAVFGLDAFDDMGTGRDAGAIVGSFDTLAPEGRWSDLADRWLSGAAHLQPTPDHDWMV